MSVDIITGYCDNINEYSLRELFFDIFYWQLVTLHCWPFSYTPWRLSCLLSNMYTTCFFQGSNVWAVSCSALFHLASILRVELRDSNCHSSNVLNVCCLINKYGKFYLTSFIIFISFWALSHTLIMHCFYQGVMCSFFTFVPCILILSKFFNSPTNAEEIVIKQC